MNARRHGVRQRLEEHYGGKWRDHRGYWRDNYTIAQQVYAESTYDRRNAAILTAIPDKVHSLLDVGCGLGDLMRLTSDRSDIVVGIDLADANVRRATDNLRTDGIHNGRVVLSRAEALPFQTHAFDVVLMADVIEHTPDFDQVFSEVTRVLRPGGYFVCVTPHAAWLTTISIPDRLILRGLLWLLGKAHRGSLPDVFERFLRPTDVRRALDRHGMVVEVYRRICFYPGSEGGGVFQLGMFFLYRHLKGGQFAFLNRALMSIFDVVERVQFLNQKQLWVAKVSRK